MKIVVISDTHGYHGDLKKIPNGDILIHCGDITNVGERGQVEEFIEWFRKQPHSHKIFIAGNHDRSFDPKFNRDWRLVADDDIVESFKNTKPFWLNYLINDLPGLGIRYLENNGVTIDGFKFWGSPITPDFYPQHWAFNASRGEKIKEYWQKIPNDTDVLITHGPPYNKLDWVLRGMFVGCEDLDRRIDEVQPTYHLFGHIHESYGILQPSAACPTTFVNASVLNENYRIKNEPVVLTLK